MKVGRARLFKEASVREYLGVTGPAPPPRSVTKVEDGLQPRGLNREEAARYVGLNPLSFDVLVHQGQMPQATRIGNREVWDRLKLDAYMEEMRTQAMERAVKSGDPEAIERARKLGLLPT